MLSSPEVNRGSPFRIGIIEGRSFIKNEKFGDLLRKYQAWTIYEDVLPICDEIIFKVSEENGTPQNDVFTFRIPTAEIIKKAPRYIKDQTGFKKVILPISWFETTCSNPAHHKKILQLGAEWFFKLRDEFRKDYMKNLSSFLQKERATSTIYPSSPDVFRALRITPYSEVNVVILGQDPYHNGLADGLAFSSLNEFKTPKSLENIFKEIEDDIYGGLMLDRDVQLSRWSSQGVLLINTCLTVREGEAFSHNGQGWEQFTGEIIKSLYEVKRPIVWMLWGKAAQESFDNVIAAYGQINDSHLVLRAAHPSPFSASKFFGCKHFSKCNTFLASKGVNTIAW
jgi:uracil-DNA glycosylase